MLQDDSTHNKNGRPMQTHSQSKGLQYPNDNAMEIIIDNPIGMDD